MIDVNFVAVIVAAIASFVLGWLWYSPLLFGKMWMKEMGVSQAEQEKGKKEMQKKMLPVMVGGLISQLVMAYVLAHVIAMGMLAEIGSGISSGFWMWLGFVATVQLGMILWEGRTVKYYLINVTYWLAGLIAMAAIITYWPVA